jgi:ankyrin repeat protein
MRTTTRMIRLSWMPATLLILSLSLRAQVTSGSRGPGIKDLSPQELPVLSTCELFKNLTKWNGKRIAVRALADGSWVGDNCGQKFVAGGNRWPTALWIGPSYSQSDFRRDAESLKAERVRIEELVRGRRNVSIKATYVGVLRTPDQYHPQCRAWGDWTGSGFGGAPAELILETVLDPELSSPHKDIQGILGYEPCKPPNFEELCRDADLDDAAGMGCKDRVADILSTKGVDSDGRNRSRALENAIRMERKTIVKMLLDRGAPVNPADETYFFPLLTAGNSGNIDILRMVIKAGADVDRKNFNAETYVSRFGYIDVAVTRELLKAGSDPNAKNENGATALMRAAAWGHTDMVKLLLRYGAKLDLTDKNGRTVLMYAAKGENQYHYVDAIPLLLKEGADPSKRDHDGNTALDLARNAGYRFAVELLENAGKAR